MAITNDSLNVGESSVKYDSDAELAAIPLFQNYPESLLCFVSVICVLFMVIGIPGNLTTIVALARCKKLRNATAIFIINLHINEVLVCILVLPIAVMTISQRHWTLGVVMCRINSLLVYGLNAVSMFTILAITISRYVIVCQPMLYPRIYKRRNLSIMILTIWISAFGLFILSVFGIYGQFELQPDIGFCPLVRDDHNRSPETFMMYLAFVPYVTIVVCYTQIWWVIRKSEKNSRCTRRTHVSVSDNQGNALRVEKRSVSFEPSISTNSKTGEGSMQNISAVTPTEQRERPIDRFFKASLRLIRNEARSKVATRRDKKLRTVAVAVMLSYCVTHMPIVITKIAYKQYRLLPIAYVFAHTFKYSATCINPLIYVLMSKEYRQAYKNWFESIFNKFPRR